MLQRCQYKLKDHEYLLKLYMALSKISIFADVFSTMWFTPTFLTVQGLYNTSSNQKMKINEQ